MISKKLFSAVLTTLVIFSIVAGSTVGCAQTQTTTTAPMGQTIIQTLASDSNFSTLVGLLKFANLTDTLNGTTNYTMFAPSNAAFDKIPSSNLADLANNTTALKRVLLYHVVPGTLLAGDIKGNGTLTTANGLSLPYSVTSTAVTVDNANITKTDISATNGVIHVIDSVMTPPANATAAASASATAAGGFLGLPGFEALYAVVGLLAVSYLVIRRRK
ncbi:MAG: fasciclin domain-containing protein [Halobacteriota archaeon]